MYPPVSGSCSDITWLRPWPGRKSLRCWLGSFPSLRSVAAVTMTVLLMGRSRAPAPPRFTPSLADLKGGGADPGVTRSHEREDARRFLRHSHVVILSAELPRPFPSSWFSQVPRETTDGTDILRSFVSRGGLCTHGGWDAPRSAVYKPKSRKAGVVILSVSEGPTTRVPEGAHPSPRAAGEVMPQLNARKDKKRANSSTFGPIWASTAWARPTTQEKEIFAESTDSNADPPGATWKSCLTCLGTCGQSGGSAALTVAHHHGFGPADRHGTTVHTLEHCPTAQLHTPSFCRKAGEGVSLLGVLGSALGQELCPYGRGGAQVGANGSFCHRLLFRPSPYILKLTILLALISYSTSLGFSRDRIKFC